jgi:hypothetical protein
LTSNLFGRLDSLISSADPSALTSFTSQNSVAPLGAGIKEFSLEQTALYRTYIEEFEKDLESFLKSKGSSAEKFIDICAKAQELDKSNALDGFIDILTKITDFETFIEMVRSPEKRQYVNQILGMYANYLGIKKGNVVDKTKENKADTETAKSKENKADKAKS